MPNSQKRSKRKRGLMLSPEGWQRLQAAQHESEIAHNEGTPYTIEALNELTQLSPNTLSKVRSRENPVDLKTLETYFRTFGLTLTPDDYWVMPLVTASPNTPQASQASPVSETPQVQTTKPQFSTQQQDWGEAIDVSIFHGRTTELATLSQWIEQDHCRLIAVLGMGGIGKTALSVKLAEQIQSQFEFVIWRSLRNAPYLESLLSELVPFLSHQQATEPTIRQLLHCLRNHRCLVILDNVETILQAGSHAGHYRPDYENYGDLLRVVGESRHQSCLMLTSREKPLEVATFEGDNFAVRSLPLSGSLEIALALVDTKELTGTLQQKQALCEHYGCSPLALKIVASSIYDLFDGDITPFLAEETTIFNGVRRLLDQQFERLSELESSIMYWLATNREWTSIAEMVTDIVPKVARSELLTSVESLSWRSLIEKQASRYTQQPVVMEYVTDRLVERICTEFSEAEFSVDSETSQSREIPQRQTPSKIQNLKSKIPLPLPTSPLPLLYSHALLKTTVKDYVRESQARLILKPIANQLQAIFGSPTALEQQFRTVLAHLRALETQSYGGGNLINLAQHLKLDLTGYDFSELTVWHTYLQNIQLHQVNFQNADLTRSVFTQTFGSIISLAFSPDGEQLATGDMDGKTRLWQVSDGQPLLTFRRHREGIWAIAWSPDGQRFATGSEDHSVQIWDVHSGARFKTLLVGDVVRTIAWSPQAELLATGGDDCQIKLWHPRTGKCLKALSGHTDWIYSVAFSPDGQQLASGSFDRTIRLWDIATAQCLKTLQGHQEGIWDLAWSPDGQWLVSSSEDQSIRLWDIDNGECLHTFEGHTSPVFSVTWSPDSKTVASGSYDKTIRLWDVTQGHCLTLFQGNTNWVWAIDWSPNGDLLASGSHDRTVRFWEAKSGQCRQTLQGYTSEAFSLVWSPNGQMLASSGNDQTVRLWHPQTGQCLKILKGHTNWVWALAWSPDGQTLASGSDDQTIRFWQPDTGQCLQILEGHHGWVWGVDWSPDGQTLASGSGDQTVRLWDAGSGECRQILTG
ncbi:MAG: hypothetical protein F6K42_14095, partial [Leptolyngbya sp. SIO1D8]|nr:hypothetical protein [Leptolyngbya sp. SIO1D8]